MSNQKLTAKEQKELDRLLKKVRLTTKLLRRWELVYIDRDGDDTLTCIIDTDKQEINGDCESW